jgi:hypothetical protein
MYEMYPDAWPSVLDQREQTGAGQKPRRRVRKEHSVIPPALSTADSTSRPSAAPR